MRSHPVRQSQQRKYLRRLPFFLCWVCAWSISPAFWGGTPLLFGQQNRGARETVNLLQVPVNFDKDYGAAIARIGEGRFGEGRLKQEDATVVEIPAGGKLEPHRHLAEEMIYILSGRGYSLMWVGDGSKKERYDWKAGDFLSPTLNAWHQHLNASSTAPARYLSVTAMPAVRNVFHNSAILTSSDFVFEERWNKTLAQKQVEHVGGGKVGMDSVTLRAGHLLPDTITRELKEPVPNPRTPPNPRYPEHYSALALFPEGLMAANRMMEMQVIEFTDPKGSTGHNHRHLWEVVYLNMKGEGRVKLQREGEPARMLDWNEGDVIICEANEFHILYPRAAGHRFMQIKATGYFRNVGIEKWLMQNIEDSPLAK